MKINVQIVSLKIEKKLRIYFQSPHEDLLSLCPWRLLVTYEFRMSSMKKIVFYLFFFFFNNPPG